MNKKMYGELISLRLWKQEQETKINHWSHQLEELLETILKQRAELDENRRLIERLESRHSDYKHELGHLVELANKWKKRALEAGWVKS